jgi:hypothetical protein
MVLSDFTAHTGVWVVSMHGAQLLALAFTPERTSVGVEPAGCVWVGMRGAALDGALTVAVAPDWRARLNPADLGQAIALATADAVFRRAEAWAEQLACAPNPFPAVGHPVFDRLTERGADADAWVGLAFDADDELDAVVAQIEQAAASPAHGRSDGDRICVVVQRGAVTDVRIDQRWLATAAAEALAAHTGQALRAAFAAAELAIVEPLQQSPALRDLRNLTARKD